MLKEPTPGVRSETENRICQQMPSHKTKALQNSLKTNSVLGSFTKMTETHFYLRSLSKKKIIFC